MTEDSLDSSCPSQRAHLRSEPLYTQLLEGDWWARAIIQQVILDRWNPLRLNKKIASHFGLTINQVRHIRSKPAFQAEYSKQLAIYQRSFDEIQLADRKERVMAMQELY